MRQIFEAEDFAGIDEATVKRLARARSAYDLIGPERETVTDSESVRAIQVVWGYRIRESRCRSPVWFATSASPKNFAQDAFVSALSQWSSDGIPRNPGARVMSVDEDYIPGDLLRLMFVACHPVLSVEARLALTLRLLGGLSTTEIARAFLSPEPTVARE